MAMEEAVRQGMAKSTLDFHQFESDGNYIAFVEIIFNYNTSK